METFGAIQLMFINFSNLAMLIYIGYNDSLIGKFANRLEMFNEIMVCFISFHMYFFTDWVLDKNNQPDKDLQYRYGISMNCFITYYIYTNLLIICYYTFKTYWLIWLKWSRIYRMKWFGLGRKPKVSHGKLLDRNDPIQMKYPPFNLSMYEQ